MEAGYLEKPVVTAFSAGVLLVCQEPKSAPVRVWIVETGSGRVAANADQNDETN